MSFSKRLKERRENLGLSRLDLARKLGVTASAIANYENDVSSPKTELLYELFDALECDANYLYQDVIHMDSNFTASLAEWDLIHKYRELTNHGRELVDLVVNKELTDARLDGSHTYGVAARSKDAEPKELHLKQDFDPESIKNEVDF